MTLDILADLLTAARQAGADAADVVLFRGTSISVERRLGQMEQLERAESTDLGLRVFVGERSAQVAASSLDARQFRTLAARAVAMARLVPADPFGGLVETEAAPDEADALELDDAAEPDLATLIARAQTAEEAALQVPGVSNSEGGSAGYSRTEIFLVTSAGFAGGYARTRHSVSASVLAGSGTGMQRDYAGHLTAHLADLEDAEGIGRRAGERAVARLNPQRPATAQIPVVYDQRVSGSLIRHLATAASGAAVARGTSFLKDRLGQRILPEGVSVIDDPRRRRGLSSRTFDGEGVATARRALVEDGVLATWLLDGRSARQLGMRSTGHAARGTGGPPAPAASNLYLEAGAETPAALMADIGYGLYITEMIGTSLNPNTGDYSRGASGFLIRDGALAEPVAEITVAGNLLDMWRSLRPADDLEFRRGTDAPTIRIEGMVMAGGVS